MRLVNVSGVEHMRLSLKAKLYGIDVLVVCLVKSLQKQNRNRILDINYNAECFIILDCYLFFHIQFKCNAYC